MPIPLDRVVEVAVSRSSEDYPPMRDGSYGTSVTAGSQSQDKFMLAVGNDLENGVRSG